MKVGLGRDKGLLHQRIEAQLIRVWLQLYWHGTHKACAYVLQLVIFQTIGSVVLQLVAKQQLQVDKMQ